MNYKMAINLDTPNMLGRLTDLANSVSYNVIVTDEERTASGNDLSKLTTLDFNRTIYLESNNKEIFDDFKKIKSDRRKVHIFFKNRDELKKFVELYNKYFTGFTTVHNAQAYLEQSFAGTNYDDSQYYTYRIIPQTEDDIRFLTHGRLTFSYAVFDEYPEYEEAAIKLLNNFEYGF